MSDDGPDPKDFYEEDEPIEDVVGAFAAGEPGVTEHPTRDGMEHPVFVGRAKQRTPDVEGSPDLPPPRPFFYTLEQVAQMIGVSEARLKDAFLYFVDRTPGPHYPDFIKTTNLAPLGTTPDWRINAVEVKRWLEFKGYRLHHRGWV